MKPAPARRRGGTVLVIPAKAAGLSSASGDGVRGEKERADQTAVGVPSRGQRGERPARRRPGGPGVLRAMFSKCS